MPLALEEVEYFAGLARLDLNPAEKDSFRQQLSTILDYFTLLERVNTQGISPTSSALLLHSRLREDIPVPGLSLEELLRNSKETDEDQFRLPPVFANR